MSGVKETVVKVKEAAELRGMTEDEVVSSLRGRAKFRQLDGELVVNREDLAAALKAGIIKRVAATTETRTADAASFLGLDLDAPGNSSTEPAKPETIPDPFAPVVDPATEARTAEMAKALGIDLSPTSLTTATANKPKGRQPGAPITARADDDEGYRLGKPRRWGQT